MYRLVVCLIVWMLCLGVAVGSVAQAASKAQRPNVIIILADDLGYGDLACYGNMVNQTPHLDQLAREGLRFTDFHTNGPMCSPTRVSLLTGLYQNRFGRPFERALSAQTPEIGLPDTVYSMPKMFKESGYATAMYGKWHLGYQAPSLPNYFGFDDFRGLLTGGGDHISHINRSGELDWFHNEQKQMEEGYSVDLITDHSIDFMKKHKEEPFFLYVSHLAIHFPWQAPGEKAHRKEGGDYWNFTKLGPHPEGENGPVVRAMVESLDAGVGRIMAALRELDLDDNTLVFFTSDNGGYTDYDGMFSGEISSNAPFRGKKTQVWEGGHRVPAIAWWPKNIQAGAESDAVLMTMDMLPTFAEMLGRTLPGAVDGRSVESLFFEQGEGPERAVFWRMDTQLAVRRGPWKLVVTAAGRQLFNLDDDVSESNDLAAVHPHLVRVLSEMLSAWEAEMDVGLK